MTKAEHINLVSHWERILSDEGMAEISLFDNTGKNKSITFISATLSVDLTESSYSDDEWGDRVNAIRFGSQVKIADTDHAEYWRLLGQSIESLPPGWPEPDRSVLREWADCGDLSKAARKLHVTHSHARTIKGRFERWISAR